MARMIKTEGGACRRASQCERWNTHQEIKSLVRKLRRQVGKMAVKEQLPAPWDHLDPWETEGELGDEYGDD